MCRSVRRDFRQRFGEPFSLQKMLYGCEPLLDVGGGTDGMRGGTLPPAIGLWNRGHVSSP
jgi:hypothetical protein